MALYKLLVSNLSECLNENRFWTEVPFPKCKYGIHEASQLISKLWTPIHLVLTLNVW